MTGFAPCLFAIGCVVVGCQPGGGLPATADEGPGVVEVIAAESAESLETEAPSADTGVPVGVEPEASEVAAEPEASEVAAETEASEVAAETETSEVAAETETSEVAAETETTLAEAEVGLDTAPPSGTAYGAPIPLGALSGAPETSGIVASRDHPGIFWIHNDSGNPAEILAIDTTPRVVATIALPDAQNQDWEAIALMPRAGVDALYVGDIGDNVARITEGVASGRLGTIRLYRFDEPDPASQEPVAAVEAPETIDLTYPDGPHDCESLFLDPATGDAYVFSKVRAGDATLYVARAPLVGPGPIALTAVATLDMGWITAADLAADGTRLAVRSYGEIRVFQIAGSIADALATTPWRPSAEGSAAEAIAFGAGSYDLYTIAEGEGATLFQIPWE